MEDIKKDLDNYENSIIDRTQASDIDDQTRGKLIERTPADAEFINDISKRFFDTIFDVCRHAKLARKVNVIPAAAIKNLKQAIISDKIIPGAATLPITKQLDDALKRSKHIIQRTQIILRTITRLQKGFSGSTDPGKNKKSLIQALKLFQNQQPRFITSLHQVVTICEEIAYDRRAHIKAIETACNKKKLMLISNIKQKYWSNKEN